MKNKNLILAIIILSALSLIILLAYRQKDKQSVGNPSPSATIVASPNSSVLSSPNKSSNPQKTQYFDGGDGSSLVQTPVSYSLLTKPATCNLSGLIDFQSNTIAANYNPQILYTGIDHPGRQIKWTVAPYDQLKIGPNIDAQLKLPDGTAVVQVVLPQNPKSKNYILKAIMTYGRLENGGIIVREAVCNGQINVKLSY